MVNKAPRGRNPARTIKAIVLVSGGIDSTVALYWAVKKGWEIVPLTIDYHARPEAEKNAVSAILKTAGVRAPIKIPMDFLKEIEDLGEEGVLRQALAGAPAAYVPARNMIFYSIAAHYAEVLGAEVIVGGHNNGDPQEFPDSSPRFFEGIGRVMTMGLWSGKNTPLRIELPLKKKTKAQVIRLGIELGAPLQLTWSCHYDFEIPCGKCPSCLERAEAFNALGLEDPRPHVGGKGIYRGDSSSALNEAWDH